MVISNPSIPRRLFLNRIRALSLLVGSLPLALTACQSNDSAETAEPTSNAEAPSAAPSTQLADPSAEATAEGFKSGTTTAELSANPSGVLLEEGFEQGPVLIVETDSEGIVAVNPTCLHQRCLVEWDADETLFVCPCHDSRFEPSGALVQGPATEPLASIEVKVEGDLVLVKDA